MTTLFLYVYKRLTQVNSIQVGASLLRHIYIHVEEDHWVSKVLPWAWIQHQHGIMDCGAREKLLSPVGSFPSIQSLADTESSPGLVAHRAT